MLDATLLGSAGGGIQWCLHGYDACMVHGAKGAFWRICRQKQFSPSRVFLFSRNSWHLWIGRARHPGPAPQLQHVALEVFNVGGWLTHGDLALEVGVDFLAVGGHRLIPARVRSEWPGSRVLPLSGLPPVRIPPMLVVLVLGLSA